MRDITTNPASPAADGVVCGWWKELQRQPANRAHLRRCAVPADAFLCDAFHELNRRLRAAETNMAPERVAVLAILLASVKENTAGQHPAARMAAKPDGGRCVSPLRMRRLLRCEKGEDLLSPLRRILPLLDGRMDVTALSEAVRYWGPRQRREWSMKYFENVNPTKQGEEQ